MYFLIWKAMTVIPGLFLACYLKKYIYVYTYTYTYIYVEAWNLCLRDWRDGSIIKAPVTQAWGRSCNNITHAKAFWQVSAPSVLGRERQVELHSSWTNTSSQLVSPRLTERTPKTRVKNSRGKYLCSSSAHTFTRMHTHMYTQPHAHIYTQNAHHKCTER